MRKTVYLLLATCLSFFAGAQNREPLNTEIVTEDIPRFWQAFEKAKPSFKPEAFDSEYIKLGTRGLKGFTRGRIENARNLAKVVSSHPRYYASIRPSTERIAGMKDMIIQSLVKLKQLYPEAIFPPVYFVVGALNSGGTTSKDGLIIGADMYGLTDQTPTEELNDWLKDVIKPVDQIPHVVAHELVHFQQNYDGRTLLEGSIKEGSADFIAELISGKHINSYVHEYANPREKELWEEFRGKMDGKDYKGWLYSGSKGRPHDLGYWMGYKITRSYYEHAGDKQQAIHDILNIKDFKKFLADSRYEESLK